MRLFSNNASSTLASNISAGSGSLTLNTGDGSKFPSPSGVDYFLITLGSGSSSEIVKCTARTGDVLTITRAQESTAASSWASGTTVSMRITAGIASEMVAGTGGGGGAVNVFYITTVTASNSAQLELTGLDGYGYSSYEFRFLNILPATDAVKLRMVVQTGGSTWFTGVTDYTYQRRAAYAGSINTTDSSGQAYIEWTDVIYNAANYGMSGEIKGFNFNSSSVFKMFFSNLAYWANDFVGVAMGFSNSSGGFKNNTSPLTGVRFYVSTGNITSGSIQLWGYT